MFPIVELFPIFGITEMLFKVSESVLQIEHILSVIAPALCLAGVAGVFLARMDFRSFGDERMLDRESRGTIIAFVIFSVSFALIGYFAIIVVALVVAAILAEYKLTYG